MSVRAPAGGAVPGGADAVAERLRAALGSGATAEPEARRALAIAGVVPALVARPAGRAELGAAVAAVAAAGGALVPLGLGAHRALGHPPARYDLALSTAGLARVRDYTPADMTVTVEAGVTLAALADLLAGEGQWLPLEPPLPGATTAGGLIAADLGGWLRASQGRVRDFVIGIEVVTAAGTAARAGGRVVKNVAGYDLMKLMTGSLGTLAVVTEVTFKVRPRPAVARCLALRAPDLAAALALGERVAEPGVEPLAATLAFDVGGGEAPRLVAVLGGVDEDVSVARARLLDRAAATGAEVELEADAGAPAARALSEAARDFSRAAPGSVVARLAGLPRRGGRLAATLAEAFRPEGGRALLDPRTGAVTVALDPPDSAAAIARLAALAEGEGAHLVLERCPDALAETVEVWRPLPAALPLMRRMKQALDPAGTLAPGRFVGRI
jgi:glycolate oxidase FAD binding subunit